MFWHVALRYSLAFVAERPTASLSNPRSSLSLSLSLYLWDSLKHLDFEFISLWKIPDGRPDVARWHRIRGNFRALSVLRLPVSFLSLPKNSKAERDPTLWDLCFTLLYSDLAFSRKTPSFYYDFCVVWFVCFFLLECRFH